MLRKLYLALVALVAVAIVSPALARVGDWKPVGSERLRYRASEAKVDIGVDHGLLSALQLNVTGRSVYISKVKIQFGNDQSQDVSVDAVISEGGRSGIIEFRGPPRRVQDITIEYDIRRGGGRRGRPVVEVQGREAAPFRRPVAGRRGAKWEVVATERFETGADRLVIKVGRRAGRIGTIKLKVLDRPVVIRSAQVRFGNGSTQDIPIREVLDDGDETAEFDLEGRRGRFIDTITLDLRKQRRSRRAGIEVHGEVRRGPIALPIPRGWKALDEQTVDTSNRRMTLPVGYQEGAVKQIQLRVLRGTLAVRRMNIVFGNGETQRVRVRDKLEAGESTEIVDLLGERRFIKEVELMTSPRRSDTERARVQLIGEIARRGPARRVPRGWEKFGSKTVGFLVDRDVIRVGRDAGRFDQIALRVLNNDVYFHRVRVVFGNGEAEEFPINDMIPADGSTEAIKLRGGRFIDRIEMVYQSRPSFRGRAEVEAYGEYADSWRRGRGSDRGDRRRGGDGDWVSVGSAKADMWKPDLATFEVGPGKGRFRKLKLKILRHDVRVFSVRVIYGNGQAEDLPIQGRIGDGRFSDEVDLDAGRRGRGRRIRSVQVRHQTKINFKGEGATEVWLMQ